MANEMKIREKKNRKENAFLTMLMFISICVCLFAGQNLYSIFAKYKAGTDEYDKIQKMVVVEKEAGVEAVNEVWVDPEKKGWEAPVTVDFEKLQEINEDVCGWLYAEAIPDINYPVVQTEDNDYYLHRTYEKKDNFAGALFVDCDNSNDFNDCNTIIYGHNMKNGSMFGQLKKYKEQGTYECGKYLWVLTPEENLKYEIFAAYVTPVKSETYTIVKGPGKEQKEYAEHMYALSQIDTGEHRFELKDKILTLSTCTGDESTRYVVQAVQIQPDK